MTNPPAHTAAHTSASSAAQTPTTAQSLRSFFAIGLNIAFGDAFSLVSGAIFVITLARTAGADTLGVFSFTLALAGIAQTICDAGFDITLARSIGADAHKARPELHKAMRIKLLLCAAVLPCAAVIAGMKNSSALPFSLVMMADVLPSTIAYAYVCALRGLHHSNRAARINALYNGVPYLAAAVVVLLYTDSLLLCAAALLAGDILKLMHLRRVFEAVASADSREDVNQHESQHQHHSPTADGSSSAAAALKLFFHEQGHVTLINILSSLLVRLPVLMLGWFGTNQAVGFFSAASRFTTAARILPGAFLHTILPQYTKRKAQAPRIRMVLIATTAIAVAAGAALALSAPLLMHWTFTFQSSVAILQVLALGFVFLSIKTVLEGFLLATHHEQMVTTVLALTAIVAAGAYLLVASSSAMHVATVSVASELVACIAFAIGLMRWSALHASGATGSTQTDMIVDISTFVNSDRSIGGDE
ncbi:MAG: Polysaccharide biosynthesis protein [Bacteroidota bacterium]